MVDARLEVLIKLRDQASRELDGLTKKTRGLGSAMKSLRGPLLAAGAAAVGSTIAWSKAGDEVQKMAIRTGFTTESLSELRFALQQSGSSIQGFEGGIRRMSGFLEDAKDGLSTSVIALEKLNLSTKDFVGLNPEDAFFKFANSVSSIEDEMERAAIAQDIFGRSGTALLPLMAEGADGMQALRAEAHELGIVFDQEAADKAAQFADASNALSQVLRGMAFQIAEIAGPILTKLARGFEALPGPLQKVVAGVGLLAVAMKFGLVPAIKLTSLTLKTALIGSGIGIVLVAIGLLILNWKTVQRVLISGAAAIQKYFVGAFSNAKDSIVGILNDIIIFFTGMPDRVANIGKLIANAIIGQLNKGIELINLIIPDEIGFSTPFGFVGVDLPDNPLSPIPRLQHGAENFEGGLAVVGEAGPELVSLPQGSDVISSIKTLQALRQESPERTEQNRIRLIVSHSVKLPELRELNQTVRESIARSTAGAGTAFGFGSSFRPLRSLARATGNLVGLSSGVESTEKEQLSLSELSEIKQILLREAAGGTRPLSETERRLFSNDARRPAPRAFDMAPQLSQFQHPRAQQTIAQGGIGFGLDFNPLADIRPRGGGTSSPFLELITEFRAQLAEWEEQRLLAVELRQRLAIQNAPDLTSLTRARLRGITTAGRGPSAGDLEGVAFGFNAEQRGRINQVNPGFGLADVFRNGVQTFAEAIGDLPAHQLARLREQLTRAQSGDSFVTAFDAARGIGAGGLEYQEAIQALRNSGALRGGPAAGVTGNGRGGFSAQFAQNLAGDAAAIEQAIQILVQLDSKQLSEADVSAIDAEGIA